jgi:hypothetical protein
MSIRAVSGYNMGDTAGFTHVMGHSLQLLDVIGVSWQ